MSHSPAFSDMSSLIARKAGGGSDFSRFELQGEFGGFIRNVEGKRRLALRTPEGERLLKVPKSLRERIFGSLAAGQAISVSGLEYREHGETKRAVLRITILEGPVRGECFACPIQVCAKKNCWKQGGRELWRALETEIALAGLEHAIRVEQVDCVDRCKHAPNLDCGALELERCNSETVSGLVRALAD